MPGAVGNQLLTAASLTEIIQNVRDPREQPGALLWNTRVPSVPSTPFEVRARYTGRIYIADLIADGQKAVTYSPGKFTFESSGVINLKLGQHWDEAQIEEWDYLSQRMAMGQVSDQAGAGFSIASTLADLRVGVLQRKNQMNLAMLLDGFSYDRLGVKMENVSWGMPSDLKTTLTGGDTWDNVGALPITNILDFLRYVKERYGEVYNTLTMSSVAFRHVVKTTEFQNLAKALYFNFGSMSATLPSQNTTRMQEAFTWMLGGNVTVEFDDTRFWQQDAAGVDSSYRMYPISDVLFTNSADFGNTGAWKFADCEVIETIAAGMMGGASGIYGGTLGGRRRGPVAYLTGNPDLNPPDVTTWAVARGAPVKKRLTASAKMTVGAFAETIPVGEPF